MVLEEYYRKRDFKKTKEPKNNVKKLGKNKLLYVIQEHFASHHHFDLRLEHEGILKSWAIPKNPPSDPKEKRLAVLTEDHPLSYGLWEGTIPEGQYGAGTVEIWDKGTYEMVKWKDEEIIVDIHGKKLKGFYVLIKTRFGGSKNSWLFFKKKE